MLAIILTRLFKNLKMKKDTILMMIGNEKQKKPGIQQLPKIYITFLERVTRLAAQELLHT